MFFLLPFYQLEAIWPFPSDITRIFTQRTLAHWIFSHFIPVNPEDGCAGDSVQEQVYLIKRLLNVWSMNLQDYAVVCAMFLDCIDFLFVFLCIYFNEYYLACLHFISFDDSVFNGWWSLYSFITKLKCLTDYSCSDKCEKGFDCLLQRRVCDMKNASTVFRTALRVVRITSLLWQLSQIHYEKLEWRLTLVT